MSIKLPKILNNRLGLGLMGLLVLVGTVVAATSSLSATTGGTLYISPASGSYTVGDQFSVALRENSGSTSVNGVQATITFPAGSLQLLSADAAGAFAVAPPDTTGSGSIQMTRGAYSGQTGDQLVSNLTFKVLQAGTAAVSIDTGSSYVAATSDGSHITLSFANGSYTLANAAGVQQDTSSPPPANNNTGSTGSSSGGNTNPSAGSSSGSAGAGSGSITAKPQGVNTPVNLPDGSSAQISAPVTVQPTDTSDGKVQKVVYYLNGKQVATVTTPPYKYQVDTTKLKNGTYTLVSKTYYTNGKVTQSTQTLHVKNAASHTALWELLALLLVLLLIIGGGFTRGRWLPKIDSFFGHFRPQPPLPVAPLSPTVVEPSQPPVTSVPVMSPPATAGNFGMPPAPVPAAPTTFAPPVTVQPTAAVATPQPLNPTLQPAAPSIHNIRGISLPAPGTVIHPTVYPPVQ